MLNFLKRIRFTVAAESRRKILHLRNVVIRSTSNRWFLIHLQRWVIVFLCICLKTKVCDPLISFLFNVLLGVEELYGILLAALSDENLKRGRCQFGTRKRISASLLIPHKKFWAYFLNIVFQYVYVVCALPIVSAVKTCVINPTELYI